MTRAVASSAFIALVLAAGGCATTHAGSYVERGIDFAQYRTYDWAPPDPLPVTDPRLAENAYFQDYVEGAVQRGLAGKGFGRMPATDPDLLVHYHASVTQRIRVDPFEQDGRVREYEAGMLVLDVLDARSGRLVWRGWARHGVADILNNPERMAARLNAAVAGMLKTMPGGGELTAAPAIREEGDRR